MLSKIWLIVISEIIIKRVISGILSFHDARYSPRIHATRHCAMHSVCFLLLRFCYVPRFRHPASNAARRARNDERCITNFIRVRTDTFVVAIKDKIRRDHFHRSDDSSRGNVDALFRNIIGHFSKGPSLDRILHLRRG